MIELVIFDCDGVLVDSELLARAAMQTVYAKAGIEVTDAMVDAGVGRKMSDILAIIEDQTGRPLPVAYHAQFWPTTRDLFTKSLRPTDGITGFLEGLAQKRCVASSSHHERIRHSLATTGLDRFFANDAIFSSSDVARGKPAPDLFLHAAQKMAVAPDRCLVVEDSRFGIMGAKAAGMTACGFVGGSHLTPLASKTLYDAGADVVAPTFDAVAEWLADADG